ncbi:MAG TPA: hypothetical protein VLH56_19535 [Dissulfurispiraceae bacterium]|nr:hypothetical protein [Dissulfurispiraceae bacterium]
MDKRRELGAKGWYLLKTDYITGLHTFAELAEKYDVSIPAIKKHSASEDWAALKREYQQGKDPDEPVKETKSLAAIQAEAERDKALVQLEMAMLDKMQFDLRTERVTDVVAMLAAQLLTADYNRVTTGGLEAMQLTKKDWAMLIAIIKDAQAIKYRSLGIPPPVQLVDVQATIAPGTAMLQQIREFIEAESGGYKMLPGGSE